MAFSSPRETVRVLLAEAVAGLAIEWGFAASAQVAMERTKRPEHGDFATNVALTLTKVAGKPPRAIADAQVTRNALPLLGVSAPEQMTRLEENITKEDD